VHYHADDIYDTCKSDGHCERVNPSEKDKGHADEYIRKYNVVEFSLSF
jgi:hypothetical protein